MVECGCASVVIFNGDYIDAIVVDINVESIFRITLEACACCIGLDRLQSSMANASVTIEIAEIFFLADAAPCRIGPVENTCAADGVDIPIRVRLIVVSVRVFYGKFKTAVRLLLYCMGCR